MLPDALIPLEHFELLEKKMSMFSSQLTSPPSQPIFHPFSCNFWQLTGLSASSLCFSSGGLMVSVVRRQASQNTCEVRDSLDYPLTTSTRNYVDWVNWDRKTHSRKGHYHNLVLLCLRLRKPVEWGQPLHSDSRGQMWCDQQTQVPVRPHGVPIMHDCTLNCKPKSSLPPLNCFSVQYYIKATRNVTSTGADSHLLIALARISSLTWSTDSAVPSPETAANILSL